MEFKLIRVKLKDGTVYPAVEDVNKGIYYGFIGDTAAKKTLVEFEAGMYLDDYYLSEPIEDVEVLEW